MCFAPETAAAFAARAGLAAAARRELRAAPQAERRAFPARPGRGQARSVWRVSAGRSGSARARSPAQGTGCPDGPAGAEPARALPIFAAAFPEPWAAFARRAAHRGEAAPAEASGSVGEAGSPFVAAGLARHARALPAFCRVERRAVASGQARLLARAGPRPRSKPQSRPFPRRHFAATRARKVCCPLTADALSDPFWIPRLRTRHRCALNCRKCSPYLANPFTDQMA